MNQAFKDQHPNTNAAAALEGGPVSSPRPSLRDRWEALRYGRTGRILGFILAFAAIFLLVFLALVLLQNAHF